jgi:hypothetical protein
MTGGVGRTVGLGVLVVALAAPVAQGFPTPMVPRILAPADAQPAQNRGDPDPGGSGGGGDTGAPGDGFDTRLDSPPVPGVPAAPPRAAPPLAPPRAAAVPAVTTAVVRALSEASDRCSAAPLAYRADCLAGELAAVASRLPNTGDYAEARRAITDAAREIGGLTRRNRDRGRPALALRPQPGAPESRPFSAVRADAVDEVNRAAISILEEAQTTLLRSAANSEARRVHYQRIAGALESGKVLLRS